MAVPTRDFPDLFRAPGGVPAGTKCRRKADWVYLAPQSPLAWLCHAVPPLHKGGCGVPPVRWPDGHTALPRWAIEPRPVVCWASLSPGKHNRLFPWHWARTALWPLPGDGLSHPEHPGKQRMMPETGTGPAARWWISLFFVLFLDKYRRDFPLQIKQNGL